MATESQLTATDTEVRIDALLNELTLDEKAALLAGASMWLTPPIERLGIPAMKVTDGPNGARGGGSYVGGEITSACFPVEISLASTWNTALIEQVGKALAQQSQSKGAQMLLAPTVNIHRSPLNGRNFECFSEDPYLTSRLAVAYINGLQSENVGATVKHFVGNDSEFERNTISSEIDERTLREIYLPPFQAAVQEAGSWGVMASYNKLNGTYTSEHAELLRDLLKEEWGFEGLVMSDWFGTKSTVDAANNGLDLEMPGPPAWRGQKLVDAVEAGQVALAAIDDAVRRMLRVIFRSGVTMESASLPERAEDLPEQRMLIRAAAAEGVVLLKNRNVLPLDPAKLSTLAVIGPNARQAQIMGGGSAQVATHYAVTPYAGIEAALGEQVELRYAIGTTNHKLLPQLRGMPLATAEHPMQLAFFNTLDLSGDVVANTTSLSGEQVWMGNVAPGVDPAHFSARLTAQFVPFESGEQTFSLVSTGLSRLFVDGELVIDNWQQRLPGDTYFGTGSAEATGKVPMQAGQPYQLVVEYSNHGATLLAGVRIGYLPPVAPDSIAQAVELAAGADAAVVFVGLTYDWESEGFDRPDMELVGEQNELIAQVAAANLNTVVVVQTGAPISMPWLDSVAAVLQAWYPGQECGNAIADVLFGTVTPSGKLPQTFPLRLEDNPAFINYPGENGRVRYGEGIFVGYRYYEKKRVAPLFPFGFGLSYTTFSYDHAQLSAATLAKNDVQHVSINISNTGERAGQEIVQLYIRDVGAQVTRPLKELKGFAKVALAAGETARVEFVLDRTALAYWDDGRHAWVAEAGTFEVLIGASSEDIRARLLFELSETMVFGGPARQRVAFNALTPIRLLIGNDEARAVLEQHLPGFSQHPQFAAIQGMSLEQVSMLAPDQLPAALVEQIAIDLERL